VRPPRQSVFTSFALALAVALIATGCQTGEPLVPRSVYEKVNDDGREWTYDTAWQNIRRVNANLEDNKLETVGDEALFIASQMERLETGKAGSLASFEMTAVLEEETRAAESRDRTENLRVARELGQKLQERFDAGDFESAKSFAISLHATALTLETSG